MKGLTNIDRQKLQSLFFKIRSNYATVKDYNEYENLLLKAGFTSNEIRQNLKTYNLMDWDNYYQAKEQAKSYEQKRVFEVIIKGALLGLGLATLVSLAKEK